MIGRCGSSMLRPLTIHGTQWLHSVHDDIIRMYSVTVALMLMLYLKKVPRSWLSFRKCVSFSGNEDNLFNQIFKTSASLLISRVLEFWHSSKDISPRISLAWYPSGSSSLKYATISSFSELFAFL